MTDAPSIFVKLWTDQRAPWWRRRYVVTTHLGGVVVEERRFWRDVNAGRYWRGVLRGEGAA